MSTKTNLVKTNIDRSQEDSLHRIYKKADGLMLFVGLASLHEINIRADKTIHVRSFIGSLSRSLPLK